MYYDEMVESLYNLDRSELRRIAYECLLISDGPDKIDGDVDNTAIDVTYTGYTFVVWDKNEDRDDS